MAEFVKYGVLTPEKAQDVERDDVMIQMVVHPSLAPHLVQWLGDRFEVDLTQIPTDADDLPTFVASPRSLRDRGTN